MDSNYSEGEFLFRRRRAIQEEAQCRAHHERLSLGIPTVAGCVKVLRGAGLSYRRILVTNGVRRQRLELAI